MVKIIKKIHSNAKIDDSSFIDNYCSIGSSVVIEENVYVSKNTTIYGKALIKKGTYIGENCIIGHPQREELKRFVKNNSLGIESSNEIIEIGRTCTIRAGTIIYSNVILGDNCQTGHGVMIREKTKIGRNSLIGTNSVIDGNVDIGKNVSIQTGVYIPLFCKIGNNVFMGPYSKLTNDKYMMRKDYDLRGPTLEDEVSLGANSVILPGLKLKKGTIVGAGSIVTKDTEEYDVVVGNPAKKLKKVSNL